MSLFAHRGFYPAAPAEPNFSGLFRLIDDFDKYSQQNGTGQGQGRRHVPTFTPKFDLRETEDTYELHGELPGIEKKDVHIEFTDPQTIVVRGRTERSYTAGTPPAGLLEKTPDQMSGAITEGDEGAEHHDTESAKSNFHKPTVEDEKEDGATTTGASTEAQPTPATTVAETTKPEQQQAATAPKHKYWVSERSVGEFSRTFAFPARVEHDGVNASLNNGILTVTVPKAKKHESRRIDIN